MSDRPSHKDILQLKLSIESPSLEYAHQSASRNVAFAADIPFPLLKGWYDFMNNLKSGVAKDKAKLSKESSHIATFWSLPYLAIFLLSAEMLK